MDYFLFVSLCESALPATDLVLELVLPSLSNEEALEATFLEVTLAITPHCFMIYLDIRPVSFRSSNFSRLELNQTIFGVSENCEETETQI